MYGVLFFQTNYAREYIIIIIIVIIVVLSLHIVIIL